MKIIISALLTLCLVMPATAEIKRGGKRKSLLESDPEVVYLAQVLDKPIELTVIKEMPVFSDKAASSRVGVLKAGQKVPLEAMTDKAYRVRGKGERADVVGWVSPSAFSAPDPDFVANLKKLFQRQIEVQKLIEAKELAIGMTMDEVRQVKGKPTKTTMRRTNGGQSGSWEYVDYETVNHYTTQVDPRTGQLYRRFSHATQEEKGKVVIEFADDLVSAIEETEERRGGRVRIIVPPVVFGW